MTKPWISCLMGGNPDLHGTDLHIWPSPQLVYLAATMTCGNSKTSLDTSHCHAWGNNKDTCQHVVQNESLTIKSTHIRELM